MPLFDWGETKVAKAEAIYLQSVARLAEAREQVMSVNAAIEALSTRAPH